MGVGNEQLVDEILVFHPCRRFTAPAATLGIVDIERLALGIAFVREGHHHILFGDQVFHRQVELVFEDPGTAFVTVLFLDLGELIANHL